jgi:putative flavoprotein involved in K+ transport
MSLSELERPSSRPASDIDVVGRWLTSFEAALFAGKREDLAALFVDDAHWRDLFAFTWSITPSRTAGGLADRFIAEQPRVQASGFRLSATHVGPRRVRRTGEQVIEAIYQFETQLGRCLGILRFPIHEPGKVWTMSTALRELKGHEEAVDDRRPSGNEQRIFGGENWSMRRRREAAFEDREPAVLVVGGGHNGLCIAAKLRLLGVDTLVVERLAQVGDVWRNRYDALAFHNEIALNHLPYMPFPTTWPTYLPKDMLGEWIEAYAMAMECNVWTGTSFVNGEWDEARSVWNASVRRSDGSERVLHPRHIVFANGVTGEPLVPDVPGISDFKGTVIHSHVFRSGAGWKDRNVIVLGVGNTAHDIAQDLNGHGAKVKMMQRGSVTVFSVKSAAMNHGLYYKEGLPVDTCDLIATSITFPTALRGYQLNTKQMLENDKALLAGLKARGFRTDIGEDGGGHQMKVRSKHGGYYLNVGCSDLIVSGQIGLLQYDDFERFTTAGALMKDGRIEPADLVVTATGYREPLSVVRELLGDAIADRIGPIWGLGPDGELRNMYKPTAQQGLWFAGGGFAQGRVWSHYIALQIKAREAGLVP